MKDSSFYNRNVTQPGYFDTVVTQRSSQVERFNGSREWIKDEVFVYSCVVRLFRLMDKRTRYIYVLRANRIP